MKYKSLKSNVLVHLILFAILPLIIAMVIVIYSMYESQKQHIFHKQYQILKQVISESDDIVLNSEDIGRYLKKQHAREKHIILDDIVNLQNNIDTILILDKNGILEDFASTQNINIYKGFDYSNMEYFTSLSNGIDEYWTDVFLSTATNKPSISYSKRINKNKIAIFIIDLSQLNIFTGKFRSQDNTTMIRIVDRNGIFVAHPARPEVVAQRKSILDSNIYKNYIKPKYKNKQIIFINNLNEKSIGIYGITNKLKWKVIVKENYEVVFKTINKLVLFIIIFIIALILISIFVSFKLSTSILKPLDELNDKMDDIANGKSIDEIQSTDYDELNIVSSNFLIMQKKLISREELNRQKDKQIYESAKMAQMGEMIGNIAHQWRQPLSIISTSASGMKMEKEFSILSDEKFNSYCDGIVAQTQFLSKTIDTFRDFAKGDKETKEVILQDIIDNTLDILDAALQSHYIKIINKIDYSKKIKLSIIQDELSQVIINIFNNAKDILCEKKIEEPYIKIDCVKQYNNAIITIEDNGGGIPDNIISKVFDPYFTTKHKSQGTGLGLHMSYKIVTESLNGELYVKNSKNGAKFYIKLPII